MKVSRLNRIFERGSNRFLGVAIEENFFDSYDILSGVHALRALMEVSPNVVQVTSAQAAAWQAVATANCTLIISVDESALGQGVEPVEQALRLDAAGLRVRLNPLSRKPGASSSSSKVITRLKDACERYGMPLIVALPISRTATAQTAMIRRAVALGADVIQVSVEDDSLSYEMVTRHSEGVPLVVSGLGGSNRAVLKQAESLMKLGVRGIVLHRTTLDSDASGAVADALKAIIHGGSNATNAAKLLKSL